MTSLQPLPRSLRFFMKNGDSGSIVGDFGDTQETLLADLLHKYGDRLNEVKTRESFAKAGELPACILIPSNSRELKLGLFNSANLCESIQVKTRE